MLYSRVIFESIPPIREISFENVPVEITSYEIQNIQWENVKLLVSMSVSSYSTLLIKIRKYRLYLSQLPYKISFFNSYVKEFWSYKFHILDMHSGGLFILKNIFSFIRGWAKFTILLSDAQLSWGSCCVMLT